MGDILVGTASWTDKSLIASRRFYPKEAKSAEDRLRFYARQFPLVEVDSSYYALPAAPMAQLWVERTPPGFVFDVKAFRVFTQHQTAPAVLPRDVREALGPIRKKNLYYRDFPPELIEELWSRFRGALEPLRHAGKLGALLFQFPPWFMYRSESFEHIQLCASKLPGYRLAVEFRHQSWLNEKHRDRVIGFERDNNLVHVVVDGPQGFTSSVPAVWEATSPELSIVRFHGRNTATWQAKGLASSAERFNYLYSERELEELAAPIQSLATRARSVHAIFNVNYEDQGVVNARQLAEILAHVRASSHS